ncbi:MAG TPA: amidohydrolase [Chitinophagales bacterium]|nr:amidohydrolase [Chitinophagales bacterium]
MSRLLLHNAHVHTQDIQHPYATSILVDGERIIAVGDETLLLEAGDIQKIDIGGRHIFPGLHDAHIHIWKVGNLLTNMLDLRGVGSIDEMQQRLSDYARAHPELTWIQARGFNEVIFPDKRIPNKLDIDAVISDRPVVITRTCAHQVVANSKALLLAGLDKNMQPVPGGEIKYLASGELSGHFTETAIGLILKAVPKYTAAELRNMVLTAQDAFLKLGITAACDPAVDRDLLEVYKQMDADGELRMRINAIPIRVPDGSQKIYPNPQHYYSSHLVVNTVKFFADGGLSGKTAALRLPYLNDTSKGVMRLEKEQFYQLALESQEAGFKIATHAIGDAAVDMVLQVYDNLPLSNIEHRLEHVGFVDDNHLDIMYRRKVSAVMQPIFIRELGKNFIVSLDKKRLDSIYPIHTIAAHGINVALSTDAPVVRSFDPRTNILAAQTRKTEEGIVIGASEILDHKQSTAMYTHGSSVAVGNVANIGTIAKGRYCDLVIHDFPDLSGSAEVWLSGSKIR